MLIFLSINKISCVSGELKWIPMICNETICARVLSFWLVQNLSHLLSASFVLKKDSRQAGMTAYEEKHEVVILKKWFTRNLLNGVNYSLCCRNRWMPWGSSYSGCLYRWRYFFRTSTVSSLHQPSNCRNPCRSALGGSVILPLSLSCGISRAFSGNMRNAIQAYQTLSNTVILFRVCV